MQNLTFDPPIPVKIKEGKFGLLKPALARMGIETSVFYAVGITRDGRVIPDPACLCKTDGSAVGAPINGTHCEFEPRVLDLMRANNIKLPS